MAAKLYSRKILAIELVLYFFSAIEAGKVEFSPRPIVLWHGMGDSCCNPLSMGYIKKLLKSQLPGVYVKSLMFGNNIIEDTEHGFFGNMNKIVADTCVQIASDAHLSDGFNAIGFSQGGLFLRALAQRCPSLRMHNLISIGGPQQGIYGLPYCPGATGLCNAVRHLLDYGAYSSIAQKISVQAQYWHDPTTNEHYESRNFFLADLNCAQEQHCNSTYKPNLLRLNNFVLVKFLRDEMVVPKESEWFGYYAPDDSSSPPITMEKTDLFKKDLIGLRTLNATGRLHFLAIDAQHLQIPTDVFRTQIVDKYLSESVRPTGHHRFQSSSLESD